MTAPTSTGRRGYVGVDRRWLADGRLSDSGLRLMCWLDSHSDEYLAALHVKRTADELGWSRDRVARTIEHLTDLGLISTEQVNLPGSGSRTRTRFTLHHEVWSDPTVMHAVPHDEARSVPYGDADPVPYGEAPTTSNPNVVVTHSQEVMPIPFDGAVDVTQPRNTIAEQFDIWWAWYPRRIAKSDAFRAWHKLNIDQRNAAIATIQDHVRLWIAEGRGMSTVPYPATWLNRKSWEDELVYVAPRQEARVETRREAPGMAAVRARLATTGTTVVR